MKIIVIYDNNVSKSEVISDIIGDKGYADVVIKKRTIEDYTYKSLKMLYKNMIWRKINSTLEYVELIEYIQQYYNEDVKILHYYSNYFISNETEALLSYEKLLYIDKPYKILFNKEIAGLMFSDGKSYIQYCKNIISRQTLIESTDFIKDSFESDGFIDLSQINNFIKCITGNFDSRYFNSLQEDKYTVTKISTDKLKIKKEYTYYHLLPDDMKMWFVMPFNYIEDENTARYTMERLYMTDLAIKWVHNSIKENEFINLLNKYFYFFKTRHIKTCTDEEYNAIANDLYVNKVNQRINDLKHHSQFEQINRFLISSYIDLDKLVSKYFMLKEQIEAQNKYPKHLVIGHGDPGFANTLYNKTTQTLKFIDPKGALKEEEMWTNPYYDISKLSHCICGGYDFFNTGLFEIKVNENFEYNLEILLNNDRYKEIFKEKIIENGFDFNSVRIYEVSLFLSMLPLHMDNPYKVFGFILNVRNILEEIEKNV